MKELAKQYDPFSAEERWVKRWAETYPLPPTRRSDKPPFCIRHPAAQCDGQPAPRSRLRQHADRYPDPLQDG